MTRRLTTPLPRDALVSHQKPPATARSRTEITATDTKKLGWVNGPRQSRKRMVEDAERVPPDLKLWINSRPLPPDLADFAYWRGMRLAFR